MAFQIIPNENTLVGKFRRFMIEGAGPSDFVMPVAAVAKSSKVITKLGDRLSRVLKAHFGTTKIPEETGWILKNGERIDLSGGVPFKRTVEHWNLPEKIVSSLRGETKTLKGKIETLSKMGSETGAVRVYPGEGVTLFDEPSEKQMSKIIRDFRKRRMMIDYDNGTGSVIGTKAIEAPVLEDDIRSFVKAFIRRTK